MVTIRDAAESDVEALAGLAGQLGYPSTAAQLRHRLGSLRARADHAVLVAGDVGTVAGWIHVFVAERIESDPFAEIGGLVVDASRRGEGVGAALLVAAEAWARGRGIAELRLRSNVVRQAAHGFYEKLGYACAKRQAVFVKPLTRESGA